MKIFTDFHHSSLLRSFVLLFEERLGYKVYRPIGMDWFYNGFWAINNLEDTAKQFLKEDHQLIKDGTPPLNRTSLEDCGLYLINDPGDLSYHRAITFYAFTKIKFDIVIASIPSHINLFKRLIAEYQPQAKLIVHIGNEWDFSMFSGCNLLASVKERNLNIDINACFYHQEFDLNIFSYKPYNKSSVINSYINVLQNMETGWKDFLSLESNLNDVGISMKSYGGQCRDGNMAGPLELANSMHQSEMIFHVKDGGDGYGHVIYNAYACGRPVITRKSFYKDRLAEELMNDKNTIDLDQMSIEDAVDLILKIRSDESSMVSASQEAYNSFKNSVDFAIEAERINDWITTIIER